MDFFFTKNVNSKRDQYIVIGFTSESLGVLFVAVMDTRENNFREGKCILDHTVRFFRAVSWLYSFWTCSEEDPHGSRA